MARTIQLSDDLFAKIDEWAVRQSDRPGRSEAARRLIELALSRGNASSTAQLQRDRAAELASDHIDAHHGESATPTQRATRKRRLIDGPSMVREERVDRNLKLKK